MAPVRSCIGCRRRAGQDELVRFVRRDGTLAVGRDLAGRGAWLCDASAACVDLAIRRRSFPRALRGPVDDAAVAALRSELDRRARMAGRET